jgi:hypothetical protein
MPRGGLAVLAAGAAASLRRRRATLNHGAFAVRVRILPCRVTAEDHMDDMVVDAALWVIFAAMIALIVLGCWVTRRVPKAAMQDPDQQVDRAA